MLFCRMFRGQTGHLPLLYRVVLSVDFQKCPILGFILQCTSTIINISVSHYIIRRAPYLVAIQSQGVITQIVSLIGAAIYGIPTVVFIHKVICRNHCFIDGLATCTIRKKFLQPIVRNRRRGHSRNRSYKMCAFSIHHSYQIGISARVICPCAATAKSRQFQL